MQYKETLPAALPESSHYDKRDRQTDFSDLALIFTGAGGWWGFLSNILYRLPTVDVGGNSWLPLFPLFPLYSSAQPELHEEQF